MTSRIIAKRILGLLLISTLTAALLGVLLLREAWALLGLLPLVVTVLVRVPPQKRQAKRVATFRLRVLGIALVVALVVGTGLFVAYGSRRMNGDLEMGDQGLLVPRDHYYNNYQGDLREISRFRFVAVGLTLHGGIYAILVLRLLMQFPLSSPRAEES